MKNAAGLLLVIYLFFLVPLFAGALIDAVAGVKKKNISGTYANGFVAMLSMFWCVAVLFLYRGCTLRKLSVVWILATITICLVSILVNKKAIWEYLKRRTALENKCNAIKIARIISFIAILFSVFCVKPQLDQTVQTVMTSIDTNSAYIYQPYTGEQYPATQLEKIFSPYEMLYAVTAQISGIHPALLIKVILPFFILTFFMCCYWELGTSLFKEEKGQAVFLIVIESIYYVPVYTAVENPVTGIFRSCWNGSVMLECCILPYAFLQVMRVLNLLCREEKNRRSDWAKYPVMMQIGLFIILYPAAQLLHYKGWFYIFLMTLLMISVWVVRKGYEYVRVMGRH